MNQANDYDDRYLWDRTGPADPDVVALEGLLARYGHGRRRPRGVRRLRPWLLLAAAAAAALAVWLRPPAPAAPAAAGPRLVVGATGEVVERDRWFVATADLGELRLGDVAWLTFEPGSRVRLTELGTELTRLYLAHGEMSAFVTLDARPGFFQVDTPAARCVDLGCEYELRVDEGIGEAVVTVKTGRVAFVQDGRETYVPAGATCRATHARVGTPRFIDTDPALGRVLDAFDEASGERRAELAEKLCAAAGRPRDTLALWHLLGDGDRRVAGLARTGLARLAGVPAEGAAASIADWQEHLVPYW